MRCFLLLLFTLPLEACVCDSNYPHCDADGSQCGSAGWCYSYYCGGYSDVSNECGEKEGASCTTSYCDSVACGGEDPPPPPPPVHAHTPHTHNPHAHTPHSHNPAPTHAHTPHTHNPAPTHAHTPHTHNPAPTHAHTPHSHNPAPTHAHTPHSHNPTPRRPHIESAAEAEADWNAVREMQASPAPPPTFLGDIETDGQQNPMAAAATGKAIGFILGGVFLFATTVAGAITAYLRKKRTDTSLVAEAKAREEKSGKEPSDVELTDAI